MAQADFRVCPQCGTRNKATWEYCVRCSEDLRDVPVGQPSASSVPEDVSPPPESSPWLGDARVAGGPRPRPHAPPRLRRGEPPPPPPQLFPLSTPPPPPAAPAPGPTPYPPAVGG